MTVVVPGFTSVDDARHEHARSYPSGTMVYAHAEEPVGAWLSVQPTRPTQCPVALRGYVCPVPTAVDTWMQTLSRIEASRATERVVAAETTFVTAAQAARAAWWQAIAATQPTVYYIGVAEPSRHECVYLDEDVARGLVGTVRSYLAQHQAWSMEVLGAGGVGAAVVAGLTSALSASDAEPVADVPETATTVEPPVDPTALVTDDLDSVPAFEAFKDLRHWLVMTDEETAALVGVGRTTPYAWARDDREPRPATARRLYQVHALVSVLARQLGEEQARRWLSTGTPSPREVLVAGDLDGFAALSHDMLFGRPAERRSALDAWAAAQDAPESSGVTSAAAGVERSLRSPRRTARRGRLRRD